MQRNSWNCMKFDTLRYRSPEIFWKPRKLLSFIGKTHSLTIFPLSHSMAQLNSNFCLFDIQRRLFRGIFSKLREINHWLCCCMHLPWSCFCYYYYWWSIEFDGIKFSTTNCMHFFKIIIMSCFCIVFHVVCNFHFESFLNYFVISGHTSSDF